MRLALRATDLRQQVGAWFNNMIMVRKRPRINIYTMGLSTLANTSTPYISLLLFLDRNVPTFCDNFLSVRGEKPVSNFSRRTVLWEIARISNHHFGNQWVSTVPDSFFGGHYVVKSDYFHFGGFGHISLIVVRCVSYALPILH